jgi:hypothetical protein
MSVLTQGREDPMKTNIQQTAQLGDLVVAAFDEAEDYSSDPREVSHLATRAVMHLLRRMRKTWPAPRGLPFTAGGVS